MTAVRTRKGKLDPRPSRLWPNLLLGAGLLVILAGLYGWVRPNLLMPAKRETLQIGGQRVVMETRRVVRIPRPLCGLLIFCGLGLIFMGVEWP